MCQNDDKRELLERAAHEIDRIDIRDSVNVPKQYVDQVCLIKKVLSLPKNVHVLKNVTHSKYVIQNFTEDEADNLVQMIFELESNLNPHKMFNNRNTHILE